MTSGARAGTITVRSRPPARDGDDAAARRLWLGRPLDGGGGRWSGLVELASSPGVVSWAVARVAVLGALALTRYLVSNLGAEDPTGRPPSGLVGWDASWYLRIIESGYHHLPWESLRFFPLLPLLAKVLDPVFGARLSLLLVVNAASLGAGVLLDRLARFESGGDRELGSRAAWFLALLPPAFVLVMGYAESLLVFFAIATFFALRRQKWLWAVLFGLLAGLCRPLGVLLVLPALIEGLRGWSRADGRERVLRLAAAVAPGVGGLSYLAWSWMAYGDPMRPLRLQQEFDRRGGFENPATRLVEALRQLLDGADLGSGLHFPWAIGFLVLLVVCFRRWPASYGAYASAVLLVALSAGNLDSLERYGLSAFPLVLALAGLLRPAWLERSALVLAACGLTTYATLAFLGAYVP
jgi:hypothetical protein